MLPAGQHVWQVFTHKTTGILSIAKDGKRRLFLDCSTIDTATSKKVSAAVEESGLGSFADAPVSV
jgi:3-hydroxyisobutyrate dehydrogenase-like beta-hydroxyacid dehydrogenase